MKRQSGFTLIELMAVIAIVGILTATSIRLHGTYRQRATGSEASLMLKNILDAQIIYFLENEDFYPPQAGPLYPQIEIPMAAGATAQTFTNIEAIKAALNLTIPVGHNLSFTLTNYDTEFKLTIIAPFTIFPDGASQLLGTLSKDGKIDIERWGFMG